MIAIRLEGRLGNQLFQYAFIYSASKKLNTSFYLDKTIDRFLLPEYFSVKNDSIYPLDNWIFSISGYKNIFNFHLKRAFYQSLFLLLKFKKKSFNNLSARPQIALDQLSNDTIYEGHFQSELFFKSAHTDIRRVFSVKSKYQNLFKKKYDALYNKNQVVCVHIRRSDYLTLDHLKLGSGDLSLPLNYYTAAIGSITEKDVHFIFIGDDHQYIIENFSHIANKTIAADSEIIDFQHLLNANYCIISNSTFSWWGAWLNTQRVKTVYAPKYFMGWRIKEEIPVYIYPETWIQIDF